MVAKVNIVERYKDDYSVEFLTALQDKCIKDNLNENSIVNGKFKRWLKPLHFDNIVYDVNDFVLNFENIMSCNIKSAISIEKFKIYYPNYDYSKILRDYKEYLNSKRNNCFDPVQVSRKEIVTLVEAQATVNQRKNACLNTKEHFINRHGLDDGLKKHKHYMSTRDTRSYDVYVRKYGEEQGMIEYTKSCEYQKYVNLFENYDDIYGDEASETRERVSKSRNNSSIDHFLNKRNGNLTKATNDYITCNKKKSFTFNDKIEKYGYEHAKLSKYKSSIIFRDLCLEYDINEAIEVYESHLSNDKPVTLNKSKYPKLSRSPHSKESIKFFEFLEKYYTDLYLQHSGNSNELSLKYKDGELIRRYFYDCIDHTSNTIIEYHGIAYHPKPTDNLNEWFDPFGKNGIDKFKKMSIKNNWLLIMGIIML